MNVKFEQCVFIGMNQDTFLECDNVKAFIEEFEHDIFNYIAYFPKDSNITYSEFKEIKNEQAWTVAYHDKDDYMRLVFFNTTLEIRRKLRDIIKDARGLEYVNIYQNKDIVYF